MNIHGLGYLAKSGKDTIANYHCLMHNYVRFGFADPLKESLKPIFGLTDEHCYGALKEVEMPFWSAKFGKPITPRWLFQYYGTEIMRAWQPQIWVWANELFVDICVKEGRNVVFSDTRFFNEAHSIHEWGGKVFEVCRTNLPPIEGGVEQHASENAMRSYDKWDGHIVNDGLDDDWDVQLFTRAEEALGLPNRVQEWVANGKPAIPAAPSMVRRFMAQQYAA